MTDHDLYRATLPGGTELLLTVWDDGTHEIATRTDRCWGPPVELEPVPAAVGAMFGAAVTT